MAYKESFKASISTTNPSGTATPKAFTPDLVVSESDPLTVIQWSPSYGAMGINTEVNKTATKNRNIILYFNRDVVKGTSGTITIRKDTKTGDIVETIDVLSNKVSTDLIHVYVELSNPLNMDTRYFFSFTSGCFKDINGVAWSGTDDYNFTTLIKANAASGKFTNQVVSVDTSKDVVVATKNVAGVGQHQAGYTYEEISSTTDYYTKIGGDAKALQTEDYILNFTSATGECGFDVIDGFSVPTAIDLYWNGTKTSICGTSGTKGTINKPIFWKYNTKSNSQDNYHGTVLYTFTDKFPTKTNPVHFTFNKTEAYPKEAILRITKEPTGNCVWNQVLPAGVEPAGDLADIRTYWKNYKTFGDEIEQQSIEFFLPTKDHQFQKYNVTLSSANQPEIQKYQLGTDRINPSWLQSSKYGLSSLRAKANSITKTLVIQNYSKKTSGVITSISALMSQDMGLSPIIEYGIDGLFSCTHSSISLPHTLLPNESIEVDITISYPDIDISLNWDWSLYKTDTGSTLYADMAKFHGTTAWKKILEDYKVANDYMVNLLGRAYFVTYEILIGTNNTISTKQESRNFTIKAFKQEYASTTNDITVVHVAATQDPLAQTFFVNQHDHPEGYFASSIDLFFQNKSSGEEDVTVQLRPVDNGLPSNKDIVPFAIASLPQHAINVTSYPDETDPASYTRFKFDSPIYLSPGAYSIVAVSQSKDYTLFTSTIGNFRLDNPDIRITNTDSVGDLFRSSNGTTWVASPYQDLAFVINRAEFKTSGSAHFKSDKPPSDLSASYNRFQSTTHYNKGEYILVPTSSTIDNVYEVMNSGVSGTTTPSHTSGSVLNGNIYIQFIATAERQTNIEVPYDVYFSQGENLTFKNAEAKYFYKGTKSSGVLDTDFTQIMLGSNYELDERKSLSSDGTKELYSKVDLTTTDTKLSPVIDTTRLSNVLVRNIINGGTIAADFVSNTDIGAGSYIKVLSAGVYKMYLVIDSGVTSNEAPIFTGDDTLNGTALLRYVGTTNNGDTELLPTGGLAFARYITRKVELASGFESTDIVVRFNANTPIGTTLKVYYKAEFVDGNTTLEEAPYHEMVLSERAPNYAGAFVEHKFICDYGDNQNPGYRFALPNKKIFNQFSIKIVMLSTNKVVVPKVRDLRVIALDD